MNLEWMRFKYFNGDCSWKAKYENIREFYSFYIKKLIQGRGRE